MLKTHLIVVLDLFRPFFALQRSQQFLSLCTDSLPIYSSICPAGKLSLGPVSLCPLDTKTNVADERLESSAAIDSELL